ncbi:MAG: sugar transferase, partial [Candidatus Calescibacterium sp.]|nr:sugar transferase [Candidatus Calescibacterium sp.]
MSHDSKIDSFKDIRISNFQRYQLVFKYTFDRFLALVLLVILLPVFLIISVCIYLDDGWPIFFVQLRTGLHGRPFKMFKFRTFRTLQQNGGIHTYKGDPRVTRVGNFLRETSLDELPQLINIILGHMSFIGPRPNLP